MSTYETIVVIFLIMTFMADKFSINNISKPTAFTVAPISKVYYYTYHLSSTTTTSLLARHFAIYNSIFRHKVGTSNKRGALFAPLGAGWLTTLKFYIIMMA